MNSLLLVVHGGRRAESISEIAELTGRLADKASTDFDVVEHAFLELAEPLITEGIQCWGR